MTRLEIERDAALVTIMDALAELPDLATGVMQDRLKRSAKRLEELCAKQHDEDRNGVRRAMKLEDCPEPETQEIEFTVNAKSIGMIHWQKCRWFG